MFEFFDTIVGYAEAFWNYTIHGISASVEAIKYLLAGFGLGSVLAPLMPTIIGSAIVAMTAVLVVRMITSIL